MPIFACQLIDCGFYRKLPRVAPYPRYAPQTSPYCKLRHRKNDEPPEILRITEWICVRTGQPLSDHVPHTHRNWITYIHRSRGSYHFSLLPAVRLLPSHAVGKMRSGFLSAVNDHRRFSGLPGDKSRENFRYHRLFCPESTADSRFADTDL